ncbi:MAG TPA: SRPBCC family protein [Burkholderiales bacterium]|nr:SRPBCC family protein [Betaproteobacteria bacterium]HQR52557.1 SRPBCC family protein [Burkholderiales bacterium]
MRIAVPALALCLGIATAANAHGPTRQKVTETITINASPQKVWDVIKDFDALAKWHPAVAKSPATKGNEVGSVRDLTLKDGGKIVETLEDYSAEKMTYKYRAADGGALPVTNYSSTISVKPADGGKALVEWRGAFYRAYPNNNPPPGQDDESAVKAITGVYQSGLANLQKIVEK